MGIFLAILAAIGWGTSSIFARLGFSSAKSYSPVGGVFVSVLSSLAVVIAVSLIFQREALASISVAAILLFGLVGSITFAFSRYSHFKSVELIGASKASALSASAPLFAMFAAIVFLHEKLTALILIGILLIIGGLYSLSSRQDVAHIPGVDGKPMPRRANLWGYVFSMFAALGWGGTAALTRWGVTHLTTPLVGALLAMTAGAIILSWPGGRNIQTCKVSRKSGVVFFLLAGLMSAVGTVSNYGALELLPVVVANPLANTSPLFTLIVAFVFMRKKEIITRYTILGAVMIIAGSIFITLGRVL